MDYKPDTKDASFYNMRTDRLGNEFPPLIAKLFNETGIKCAYKPPKFVYFDIETYDTESADVMPIASR